MKKPLLFAFAIMISSTYCQLDPAGLKGRASVAGMDGGIHRDSGASLDGARAADGNRTGDGSILADGGRARDGSAEAIGLPSGSGGAATAPSTGGAVSSGGTPSAGGLVAQGGIVSAGGTPGAGGGPDAGVASDLATVSPDTAAKPDSASGPTLKLVWSDEFNDGNKGGENAARPDSSKWTYVVWPAGTMNKEKQQYTKNATNAFLDGAGHLVIRALRGESKQYTSARLDTKGNFSFRTGRIEVRAQLPPGLGAAPGIVLIGTTGTWPNGGGLALMEQGSDKGSFYTTAYTGGGSGEIAPVLYSFVDPAIAPTDFHVFSLDWYEDRLVFQVDGNTITTTLYDSTSPFASIPVSIVLFLAVGGEMGGNTIDSKAFPMEMVVDYVRVYSF